MAANNEGPKAHASPVEVYHGLRQRALNVTALDLNLDVSPEEPYGVIMEVGYPAAVMTLVAFAEGSASLYFSTGGGIIGGGAHEAVRIVTERLVIAAQSYAGQMHETTSFILPSVGQVRFYVLTPGGIFTGDSREEDLSPVTGSSLLTPLYAHAQTVIAALRLVSEKTG